MWLQEHPDVDLQRVPADMVTTSGSGLDPDITLSNALWQLDNRVADAGAKKWAEKWAKETGTTDEKKVLDKTQQLRDSAHKQIEQLLTEKSHAPLGGLVGVPLVNVLEVNLALKDLYEKPAESGK